jgi:hypothetical protein
MDYRPNCELHPHERYKKQYLKRLLKEQHMLYKYEMRYQQTMRRNDPPMVQQSTLLTLQLYQPTVQQPQIALQDPFVTMLRLSPEESQDPHHDHHHHHHPNIHHQNNNHHHTHMARNFIERFYCQLQQCFVPLPQQKHVVDGYIDDNNSVVPTTTTTTTTTNTENIQMKEHRLLVARELLRNMTKGTQQLDQFDNYEALIGYTRHKFIERAMLVVLSIHQLTQYESIISSSKDLYRHIQSHVQISSPHVLFQKSRQFVQRIQSIRTVTSIGCGPGCDAVGVIAWLHTLPPQQQSRTHTVHSGSDGPDSTTTTTTTITPPPISSCDNTWHHDHDDDTVVLDQNHHDRVVVSRVIFLDWAMPQWYPIVQSVQHLLIHQYRMVQSIVTETCDVRFSFSQQQQQQQQPAAQSPHNNNNPSSSQERPTLSLDHYWKDTDLVIVSYLFSETRNQWHNYFDDCVHQCKVGTLFLLTDPTAWQLHIFRERYEYASNQDTSKVVDAKQRQRLMEFIWLDSSMYRPELQELEGRNGPAVLLAMKIGSSI